MEYEGFNVFRSVYGASISSPLVPKDEFAEVARQLEGTLAEMNQVTDPTLRRALLSDMRRLLAEADRLAGKSAAPKKPANPDTGKR